MVIVAGMGAMSLQWPACVYSPVRPDKIMVSDTAQPPTDMHGVHIRYSHITASGMVYYYGPCCDTVNQAARKGYRLAFNF